MDEPLVIMYADGERVACRIHPDPAMDHRHYGLLVADLVRHIAGAYGVDEDEVWEFIDRERRAPTAPALVPEKVQ